MQKIWRCILFFLYYFVFLLWPSLGKTVAESGAVRIDFNNVYLLCAMALNSLLMLVFALFLCKKEEKSIDAQTAVPVFALIGWGLLILLSLFMANSAMSFLGKILHWKQAATSVIEPAKYLYLPLAVLCLLIGYSEETLFRKGAASIFSFMPVPAAHILMSVLFGLAHMAQGPIAWLFSTLAGGIFACFYVFLSKKYGPMAWHCVSVAHGAYNFMMIALFAQM